LLKIKIPDDFVERVSVVKELIINLNKLFGLAQGKEKPGFKEEKKSWSEVIKESPPEEIAHKIRLTCGLLDKLLTLAFKSVLWFIFRIFWFLRVEGKGFIPKEGPYIICPNHASYLDGFVIFSSIPFRSAISIFFLGFADIFGHPLVAWAIKVARLIPVDPSQRLIEAMQACSFVLKHKKIICIFAEGSRSISEEVQDFKKGIGILTKELDVPVIPVYIHGSHYSWPRTSRSPRLYPLRVSFGRPLNWRDLGSDYESIVRALREEVLKLSQRGTGR
jgi:long-chain acyl-CoA synthetase